MADANESTTEQTTEQPKDDLIPRAEAKAAFEARDKAKRELKAIQESGRVISEEQLARYRDLEEKAAKAEEDRKRRAGEYDSLRTQLIEKHTNEIRERDTKLSQLSERFKSTVVRAEFGAAVDYFSGSDTSKTILDVDLGMAALGRYVHVEDTDDEIGYRVVVRSPKGETILGADGNPAPFTEAIGELIKLLPNKDRILRGSGKTGSGSSGGSTNTATGGVIDTRRLRPGDFNDPKVREAVRREQDAAGGLQMGRAWENARRR